MKQLLIFVISSLLLLASCTVNPQKARQAMERDLQKVDAAMENRDYGRLYDNIPEEIISEILSMSHVDFSSDDLRKITISLMEQTFQGIDDFKFEVLEIGDMLEHDERVFFRLRTKTTGRYYSEELSKYYDFESRGYMIAISTDKKGENFKFVNYENETSKTGLDNAFNNVSSLLKLSYSQNNIADIKSQILQEGLEKIVQEEKRRVTNLYNKYKKSVVKIEMTDSYNRVLSKGTGFILSGYVVTNHHVVYVDGASEISIQSYDGTQIEYLDVAKSNEELDYAILRVAPGDLSEDMGFPFYSNTKHEVGEEVYSIGHPDASFKNTLTTGVITATSNYLYQLENDVIYGASGSPVFTDEGEVIGIISMINKYNTATFALDIRSLNFEF